ncbi:Tudor and KH domain-containing protein isoform X1 [Aix galericulata]|nr:Tudor and KH domain-containing protein isoform X1 [Aix galericulata]
MGPGATGLEDKGTRGCGTGLWGQGLQDWALWDRGLHGEQELRPWDCRRCQPPAPGSPQVAAGRRCGASATARGPRCSASAGARPARPRRGSSASRGRGARWRPPRSAAPLGLRRPRGWHGHGPPPPSPSPQKLIVEKLQEDDAFRKELARAAAARGQRKQPLGSRREPGLPAPPEHGAGGWPGGVAALLGEGPPEELGAQSEALEELAVGAEVAVPKFEAPCPPVLLGEPSGSRTSTPGAPGRVPGAQLLPSLTLGSPWGPPPGAPVPHPAVPSPEFGFPAAEPLEVYVSAAENPEHFWVQLVGERSLQLDQLTARMSRYYEGSGRTVRPPGGGSQPPAPPHTPQNHAPRPRGVHRSPSPQAELAAVQAGDIVAAPYGAEGDWYRARVLGALPGGGWDLYYVDFGDNGEATPGALRALRSDFLSLPFQAIECSLAGVAPVGTEWAEAALDAFEQLTHCARWKPLRARVCSYGRRGPRTWPRVSLSHEDLDVAAELVRLGHAAPRPREEEEEEEEWEEEEAAGDEAPRWGTETPVRGPVAGWLLGASRCAQPPVRLGGSFWGAPSCFGESRCVLGRGGVPRTGLGEALTPWQGVGTGGVWGPPHPEPCCERGRAGAGNGAVPVQEDGTGASPENLSEPRGSPSEEPPTPVPPTPSCLSPPGKQRRSRAGPGPRGGGKRGRGVSRPCFGVGGPRVRGPGVGGPLLQPPLSAEGGPVSGSGAVPVAEGSSP